MRITNIERAEFSSILGIPIMADIEGAPNKQLIATVVLPKAEAICAADAIVAALKEVFKL